MRCPQLMFTVQLLIVIVIVLDVHDSFAGSLKCSTTPGADTFVYCLLTVSKITEERACGETYRKECSYANQYDYPADLLNSVTTSSRSATTSPEAKVRERAGYEDLEETKNAHAGKALRKMFVPGRRLLIQVVVAVAWFRPAVPRHVTPWVDIETNDRISNES
jgi:hypothetical protein